MGTGWLPLEGSEGWVEVVGCGWVGSVAGGGSGGAGVVVSGGVCSTELMVVPATIFFLV